MDVQESVTRFHEATLIPVGTTPSPLSLDRLKLRLGLFDEFIELLEASGMGKNQAKLIERLIKDSINVLDGSNQDVVEMADALGDIVVVAFGMAIEMGIDLNRVLAEIMRANMSKLDENGNPLVNHCLRVARMEDHICARDNDCELVDLNQPIGKVLKASGYTPPDVASVLDSQGPL